MKAALLPVPGAVAFPGVNFPVHIFEPRYRQMIDYCVKHDVQVGICDTQKLLSHCATETEQSLNTQLAAQQASGIFSAGSLEVVKTLDDGRLAIKVHMNKRLRLVNQLQTQPFIIAECEPYYDCQFDSGEFIQALKLKQSILQRLLFITEGYPQAQSVLRSEEWQQKEIIDFSFAVFRYLKLPAEVTQDILETKHICQRLQKLLVILYDDDSD